MKTSIIIGSRRSKLALIQAESIVNQIRTINHSLTITISRITTQGDRDRRSQLNQIAREGIFVKELEEALLDGRIDIAVHSLKDMPAEITQGLCLSAITERIDHRDVLVSRSSSLSLLAPGAKIGTGSTRRAIQLAAYRPDLRVCSIRGNIDTRLRKVYNEELDGVIIAAAAMIRLGWEDKISEYLPAEHFLPAVGQGALGIEIRSGDEEAAEIVSCVNHTTTQQSIMAERAFLLALGGGCRAPIAALGSVEGTKLKLEGMAADPEGKKILHATEEGSAAMPEQAGILLARKLLEMGASEFITELKANEAR